MLNVGLMFEILFWEVEEAHDIGSQCAIESE